LALKLGIFGTGYAGLVTSVCLAQLGHTVTAIDKDPDIVASLSDGKPTIHEPGLQELLTKNLEAGRLRFTTQAEDAMAAAEIVFLCVGTPPRADGRADLAQVEEVARTIAPLIVIGADSGRARSLLLGLYEPSFDCPIVVTSVTTAELIKQTANAFLATRISFINMISDLCEKLGVDVATVARSIGLDSRIGGHFLSAGLGFGGSCLPKDLSALIKVAEDNGVDVSMLRDVEHVNTARVDRLLAKVERALWVLRHKVIGILGVAFKPDTDDIRGAPSLGIVPRLHGAGSILRIYDPAAGRNLQRLYPPDERLTYANSALEAARDAHALLILTDWNEFRSLDLGQVRSLMRTPIIVDGRNLFEPAQVQAAGFEYYSLGRGEATLRVEPKRVYV